VSAAPATPKHAARSLRLFIALWPTPAVRAGLCARRDAVDWPPPARVVADERLHLTLHFIGPVPSALWPHLLPALQVSCSGFELQLGAAQPWPHGLVVLPAASVPPPLSALHAALAGALAGLGLPVERRAFRPHVTLARRAEGAVLPAPAAALRWRCSSYVLVNSDPVDGYRVLARYGERGVTLAAAPRTATARSRPAPAPTPR
jgi:2'-5' RNA ligase